MSNQSGTNDHPQPDQRLTNRESKAQPDYQTSNQAPKGKAVGKYDKYQNELNYNANAKQRKEREDQAREFILRRSKAMQPDKGGVDLPRLSLNQYGWLVYDKNIYEYLRFAGEEMPGEDRMEAEVRREKEGGGKARRKVANEGSVAQPEYKWCKPETKIRRGKALASSGQGLATVKDREQQSGRPAKPTEPETSKPDLSVQNWPALSGRSAKQAQAEEAASSAVTSGDQKTAYAAACTSKDASLAEKDVAPKKGEAKIVLRNRVALPKAHNSEESTIAVPTSGGTVSAKINIGLDTQKNPAATTRKVKAPRDSQVHRTA